MRMERVMKWEVALPTGETDSWGTHKHTGPETGAYERVSECIWRLEAMASGSEGGRQEAKGR